MIQLRLMLASIWSRSFAVSLLLISLALSIALYLTVNRIQAATKQSFERSIVGVDLIVGARNSELPILLYSVFHIGNPQRDISTESVAELIDDDRIDWAVPIALGDSHRGYRVVGTTAEFFTRLKAADKGPIRFDDGGPFNDLFDVVLGSAVAAEFNYKLGQKLIISHGLGSIGSNDHDDLPFAVSGMMKPTGTPADRAVYVSLEAIHAIHEGWESGRQLRSFSADSLRSKDNQLKSVSAVFVGLKSIVRLFQVQRRVNSYNEEAVTAVAPGVALAQMWRLVGVADQALKLIALLVLFTALAGLVAAMAMSINVRRREMAIYRALGASPTKVTLMMIGEAALIALVACLFGWLIVQVAMTIASKIILAQTGLLLSGPWISWAELGFFAAVILAAIAATLIPAARLYRQSLRDGMSVQQ